ncbi:hypothetical protein [Leptolyngbya phage Lsp-JY17]
MFQLELLATSNAYASYCVTYHYAIQAVRFTKRVALISAVLFVALVTLSTLCIVYLYNRFESALVFTASVGSDAYDWYDNKVIRSSVECSADGILPQSVEPLDIECLPWQQFRKLAKALGIKAKTRVAMMTCLEELPEYAIRSAYYLTTH